MPGYRATRASSSRVTVQYLELHPLDQPQQVRLRLARLERGRTEEGTRGWHSLLEGRAHAPLAAPIAAMAIPSPAIVFLITVGPSAEQSFSGVPAPIDCIPRRSIPRRPGSIGGRNGFRVGRVNHTEGRGRERSTEEPLR